MSLVNEVSVTFSASTSSGQLQPPVVFVLHFSVMYSIAKQISMFKEKHIYMFFFSVQISAAKESQVNTRIGLLKLKQTDQISFSKT